LSGRTVVVEPPAGESNIPAGDGEVVEAFEASKPSAVAQEEAAGVGGRKLDRRYVTLALGLVMVLSSMEQTITSTAMPTIIGDLHGLEHYSWVASIYLLCATVSMPLYGRLADVLGRKRVIVGAIGLFFVGSLLAGSAHSMIELILYRGLQGLGAGGIMPVVLTILGDIFTIEERARIQGIFSAIWGTASLAGPALGAVLVKTLGWRAIFYVNLPFGLIGLGALLWKYHDTEKPHPRTLDLSGALALMVACATILAVVSGAGPGGWPWDVEITLGVVALCATALFIHHGRTMADPILPPWIMTSRAIGPSIFGSLLLGAGFLCLDTYVPLYVQGGRGGGVTAAAGVVTPVMMTWALSGVVAAPMIVRFGFRRVALMGAFLISLGFAGLIACAVLQLGHATTTAVLAITGCGFGPASMSYLLAAQSSVTWQHRGVVTAGIAFFRTFGGAVGIGLLGTMFNFLSAPALERLKAQGVTPAKLLDPRASANFSDAVISQAHHAVASALVWVFVAMLVIALLGIVVSWMMTARTTSESASQLRHDAAEGMMG
jgi:MFS family permease